MPCGTLCGDVRETERDMSGADIAGADSDVMLVVRDPRHPALWWGALVQLATIGVLARVGGTWYVEGEDLPLWVDLLGSVSAVPVVIGALVSAWNPRQPDRAPVEGAAWLRAYRQVFYVTFWGLALALVSLPFVASSWLGVLVGSAGLGTVLLSLATQLLVLGPAVVLSDVRRPGVGARWYDTAAAAIILPWICLQAGLLALAVEGRGSIGRWIGVLVGLEETQAPWSAWPVRAATVVFAVLLWRTAVVTRRAQRARAADRRPRHPTPPPPDAPDGRRPRDAGHR